MCTQKIKSIKPTFSKRCFAVAFQRRPTHDWPGSPFSLFAPCQFQSFIFGHEFYWPHLCPWPGKKKWPGCLCFELFSPAQGPGPPRPSSVHAHPGLSLTVTRAKSCTKPRLRAAASTIVHAERGEQGKVHWDGIDKAVSTGPPFYPYT